MSTVSKDSSSKPTPTRGSIELRIAHFNDVYQVADHLVTRDDGTQDNVNAAKFATLLKGITEQWEERRDGKKEGLTLFSGDLFSPSLASSITKGWHMTSVLNTLKVDAAVVGNHEFDFGYNHLSKLAKDTVAPWLLSNIIDTQTNGVPFPFKKYHIEERLGVRIGFIGLVQEEWVTTISKWPQHFEYRQMATVGKELSILLRDSAGAQKCDFIIALTHSHTSNDITLAKELFALSPSAPGYANIASKHGVDLLLGGHDHYYWASKGVTSWADYDVQQDIAGAASDEGDVLVVKSGSDFGDLSEIILKLKNTPSGSVRKKVIERKRHFTKEDTEEDEYMKRVVAHELPDIFEAMKVSILWTEVALDVRSEHIRCEESPIGNWIADSLREAYDDTLVNLGRKVKADGVIATAGELRGNGYFTASRPLTLLDLKRILLYDNPVVALELGGETLWAAMESGLSKWPDPAGRFPAISGFRVSWNGSLQSGHRVLGIWLQEKSTENGRPKVTERPVQRTSDPKYVILVGGYIAKGNDGYDVLNDKEKVKVILDEEDGNAKSKFLLVQEFLEELCHSAPKKSEREDTSSLDPFAKLRTRPQATSSDIGGTAIVTISLEKAIGNASHPSQYDAGDEEETETENLPRIHPVVDGRLKNEAGATR
ncbi:hypothetical protein PAXRUDRAFT_13891 [Paxillus rubicundulus Ve08.2h10]|uniref:Unplaced genomic scaffold scaffold_589, whole genome shotgun sequence n=1 Tax=Paxillus rubicundulus Ve08.2h10 TaxID=930991 RepID=A0A0D0E2V6_9AGAM|nr:hypothetical protein PAXRUDRAFT_13891 [Paxillus rubicundulus Ve08.2h10]